MYYSIARILAVILIVITIRILIRHISVSKNNLNLYVIIYTVYRVM